MLQTRQYGICRQLAAYELAHLLLNSFIYWLSLLKY